jgi:hypothetical protein
MSGFSAVAALRIRQVRRPPWATEIGVLAGGADEPVEVEVLHDVVVRDGEMLDAGRGEPYRDVKPDAADADDEDPQAGEVGLECGAPR